MSELAANTPEDIAAALLRQKSTSLRELESETGISKSRLGRIRKGEGSLTYEEGARLSEALSVPSDVFLPKNISLKLTDPERQATDALGSAMSSAIEQQASLLGPNLTTDAIETWYFTTNGRFVEMPEIRPYLIQLEAPKKPSGPPAVLDVGAKSMAAERLGSDRQKVIDYVQYLSDRSEPAIAAYHATLEANDIRTFYRKVAFRRAPTPFLLIYKTVLMPITESGKTLIWNFSKKVSARAATPAELADQSIPEGD